MLLADDPRKMEQILPGFIPGYPGPDEELGGGLPLPDFDGALWEALSPSAAPDLVTDEVPAFDRRAFWSSYHLVDRAEGSQYDILRRVISRRRDLPGHVVCLALRGGGFHGQHGRSWEGRAGNIHLCVGLACDLPAQETGMALTMLPAVAVLDALARLDPAGRLTAPGIKWVNDILIAGAKVGGVLSSVRTLEGRIRSAVLGIGLNVAAVPRIEPTPFTPRVTALTDHMTLPAGGMTTVLAHLLEALAARFGELERSGPGPLLRDYRAGSLILGRECEIRPDEPGSGTVRRGRVLAIGPDLALTLGDASEPVVAGRLILHEYGPAGAV